MTQRKRILVADDQGVNRKLTMRRLEQLGFDVDVVENGMQVIEAVNNRPYDLVFMDCHMPRMDGFGAARWIRQHEGARRRVPIIAFTATAGATDRDRCLAAGMDDFVSKPLEESELMRILALWLPDVSAVDDVTLKIDPKEMVEIFLADAPSHFAAIHQAFAAQDAKLVALGAHALKSGSGNVGAIRVYELCDELETIAGRGDLVRAAEIFGLLEAEFRAFKSSS
jgi:CheY-like chemotaxis protein